MKTFVGPCTSPDDRMTLDGAAGLAARIAGWWARRGVAVAPAVVPVRIGITTLHLVRLPPMPGRPGAAGAVDGRERAA